MFAPLSPTLGWFILGRFIKGMSSYESVGLALINDLYDDKIQNRIRNKMISLFSVVIITGYLIGGVFGGFFLMWFNDITNFWILAGLNALGVLLVIFFVRNPKKIASSPELNNNMTNNVPPNIIEHEITDTVNLVELSYNSYLKNPQYIGIVLIVSIFGLSFTGLASYNSYLIINFFQIKPEWSVGFYLLLINLIIPITMYIFGKKKPIFETLSRSSFLLLIVFPFSLILIFTDSIWIYIILMISQFFFLAIMLPTLDKLISKIIGDKYKGELLGLYRTAYFLGSAGGSLIFGYIGKLFWVFTPILVNGIMYLILFLGLLKVKQYFPTDEKPSAEKFIDSMILRNE